jgi:hypothetical protein
MHKAEGEIMEMDGEFAVVKWEHAGEAWREWVGWLVRA